MTRNLSKYYPPVEFNGNPSHAWIFLKAQTSWPQTVSQRPPPWRLFYVVVVATTTWNMFAKACQTKRLSRCPNIKCVIHMRSLDCSQNIDLTIIQGPTCIEGHSDVRWMDREWSLWLVVLILVHEAIGDGHARALVHLPGISIARPGQTCPLNAMQARWKRCALLLERATVQSSTKFLPCEKLEEQ